MDSKNFFRSILKGKPSFPKVLVLFLALFLTITGFYLVYRSLAVTQEDFSTLTQHLNNISNNGWVQTEVDAANQMLLNENITAAEWKTYFDGYFAAYPFTNNLESYLGYPVFWWGTDKSHANLHQGIYSSMFSNINKIIGAGTLSDVNKRFIDNPKNTETYSNSFHFLRNIYSKSSSLDLKNTVYTGYKNIVSSRPDLFDSTIRFDTNTYPHLSRVRGQVYINLSEAYNFNPSLLGTQGKTDIANLIKLSGKYLDIWNAYSVFIIDNNGFDSTQLSVIYNFLQKVPSSLYRVSYITQIDFLGSSNISLKGNNGINIFGTKVGTYLEDGIDDGINNTTDGFTIALVHELNHTVDSNTIGGNAIFQTKKNKLISDAGTTVLNYIRSQVVRDAGVDFFQKAPQEFFASIANSYFQDSFATFNLTQERLKSGYVEPVKQLLFFADVYAQGGSTTKFYKIDNIGNITVTDVPVVRSGDKGTMIGLIINGIKYDYTSYVSPPSVSVSSPANGATISGTVNVSISASDNSSVTLTELYLDNNLLGSDNASPYTFSLDTTKLANGSHTILVKAYDGDGNVSSHSITVNVSNSLTDTIPPTVSLIKPINGATVSGTVDVSASASDNTAIAKVEFFIDNVLKNTQTTKGADGNYGFGWDSKTVSNGSHSIQTKAYDNAGNEGTSSTITVNISNVTPSSTSDTIAPQVSFINPSNGAKVSGKILINISATDNVGVSKINLYIDDKLTATLTSYPYTYSWNTRPKSVFVGSHTLRAEAFDAAGNKGTASITVVK